MAEQLLEEQRENWGSRTGFVLAAIGSAVGLGNLWGFPYKVYDHGGGAFLIPYLLAMLLVGVPLLILEFSLGHMTQRSAPSAYRSINRKTEPVGWWGILLGFVIITYYPVILAYCGNYLVYCVTSIVTGDALPWAGEGMEGVQNATDFFKYEFLNRWTEADLGQGRPAWSLGGIVGPIAISLGVIWLLMYLCIFRGVRLVGKIVLWTVPLPWIMLLILTIRGLTLEGAASGLNFYLDPKWEQLAKPDTWRWAFGQMFFSMSLAFGVMVTYASFLHRKSDINNNATIIGLADIGTSFIAGIAVFATLGAMAFATQQAAIAQDNPALAMEVTKVVDGGPGLAFVAFPYALAQLPYPAWFGTVFFIALLTLGIDSAFSITESVLTALVDKTGWNRTLTLIGMTGVGFLLGLFYCTRGGITWLGTMDGFINSTWGGIALLGMLEAVVVGWAYRIGRLREHANERSDWRLGIWWDWLIRYVAPLLLSVLFMWSLLGKLASGELAILDNGNEVNLPILIGLIVAVLVPILAIIFSIIRSPGADAHAQHVGQPRLGRLAGAIGSVLVLGAVAIMVVACSLIVTEGPVSPHSKWKYVEFGWLKIVNFSMVPAAGAVAALLALVIGASVVHRSEISGRRPSGLARFAAGMGVMTLGAGAGILLNLFFAMNPPATTPAVALKKTMAPADLSGWSYLVASVMIALLVFGLAWCFYRAIKAGGGGAAEPQEPENGSDQP